ncbi:PRC-barrel domain containing protein [Leifsonia shinshuensis]|uniref:PRC-barrel domain-containing protein n=1 Tax=Leifsonia shinshuensis TaxID=150026 RepID=UPI0028672B06|nr:PRC-barrel domain containing protein [Leifsonia shinshuensis]MDR6972143.1 sporulation protein YlmC with PRC-barrel domain [Leifsonia shinshuensis]
MILSDLLGSPVLSAEGEWLGEVVDARLVLDGPPDGLLAAARLHGLVVSPHAHSSFAGYERTGVDAPALVARYLRWRARGSFLVLWEDLTSFTDDVIRLRAGATLYSPRLEDSEV